MKNLILVALILFFKFSYASDCAKISKYEIRKNADIIFFGQIFEVNENSYKAVVIEAYKGKLADTLEGIINHDVITPKVGSLWLLYAQDLKGGKILADACSGSKSLEWPHSAHDITFPPPPPPDILDQPSKIFILEHIIEAGALNEFYFEIMSLRHFKMKEQVTASKEEMKKISFITYEINKKNNILLGLLSLVTLILIISIIVLYKRNNT